MEPCNFEARMQTLQICNAFHGTFGMLFWTLRYRIKEKKLKSCLFYTVLCTKHSWNYDSITLMIYLLVEES